MSVPLGEGVISIEPNGLRGAIVSGGSVDGICFRTTEDSLGRGGSKVLDGILKSLNFGPSLEDALKGSRGMGTAIVGDCGAQ